MQGLCPNIDPKWEAYKMRIALIQHLQKLYA